MAVTVGLLGTLAGVLAIAGKSSEELKATGQQLNAAAKLDGFNGVVLPIFLEKSGVATSALNVGKCALRPVTMTFHEQNGEVTDVQYTFEASPYMENAHSKRLNELVNEDNVLKIDFRNSDDLHDQVGGDPCDVLDPVLVWRNLRSS